MGNALVLNAEPIVSLTRVTSYPFRQFVGHSR